MDCLLKCSYSFLFYKIFEGSQIFLPENFNSMLEEFLQQWETVYVNDKCLTYCRIISTYKIYFDDIILEKSPESGKKSSIFYWRHIAQNKDWQI